MKTLEKFLAGMIAGGFICMLIYGLTSCKTTGYGCKGRESWKQMERRINRGY